MLEMYIALLNCYVEKLLEDTPVEADVKNIVWNITEDSLKNKDRLSGKIDDIHTVFVDFENNYVPLLQLETKVLTSLSNFSNDLCNSEELLPVIDVEQAENKPEILTEEPESISEDSNDNWINNSLNLISSAIDEANNKGFSEVYFNGDGTINAPFNTASDSIAVVKKSGQRISLDDFDVLVDSILEKGNHSVESLEDVNSVIIHV